MRTLIILAILASPAVAAWADRYLLGTALLKEGKTADANRELRAALKEAEIAGEKGYGLGAILDALGHAEFRAGRYRSAKKYFERALLAPAKETAGQAAALSNAGQAYMALGEYRRAEEYLRDAIRLMPDAAPLWHRLGQAMFLQGRRTEAESAYRRALRDHDRDADVWSDLAAVLEVQNRRAEAIALLRQAVAESPAGQNRARVLRNLAVLEWKEGSPRTAAEHLQEALTHLEAAVGGDHPDVARVLDDYSEVLAKTGEKVRSREAAKRAQSIRSAFAGQDGGSTVGWRELRE